MTGRIVQGTVLGIVLAVLLNWLVYWFGTSRNVGFMVMQPNAPAPETVTLTQIIIVSIVLTIVGGVLLWILDRFTGDPLMIFLWIAAIVSIVSLIGPYSMAVGRGTFTSLGLMHIITASAAALGLAIFFQRCDTCK